MSNVLASRVFTQEDQLWFAEGSGDWNEIHVDPEIARRSFGGEQVVHGMHSVLWALDTFLSERSGGITTISATFRKPIHLGEEIDLRVLHHQEQQHVRLTLNKGPTKLIDIRFELSEVTERRSEVSPRMDDFPVEPIDLTIEQIAGRQGTLATPRSETIESGFPASTHVLGPATLTQLSAVSRLVGMICPGRYSLLSGIDLSLDLEGSNAEIEWSVSRADARVAAVNVDLSGGLVTGSVQAFVRPRPTSQPHMSDVRKEVRPDEFARQRALVVGGSRGLGELTGKLLVAGGADVVITWLRSKADSERVVDEILSSGGSARSEQLDVADPLPVLRKLSVDRHWTPTHLYYYATPPIFVRRASFYDRGLFDRFAEVYVNGFARVVEACRESGAQHLTAFFPSSVAIDETPESLLEYAAAKAAGEVVAETMAASSSWLDVVVRRLPRLPTDQTATFLPVPTQEPMAVIRDVVRATNSTQHGANDGHPE